MALKGNQKKLDKNKNGRIDAEDFKMMKKMSGGMAAGGGHKNYKMTGTLKAKTGKLVGKQKNLPPHLQEKILA